jgi:hypothetical protein
VIARLRSQRGAAIVEFVLIAPVLLLLAIGVAEFALGWKDSMTVSNGMRAGARVGSAAATTRLADYEVLQAVEAALADLPDGAIERIVVYRANGPDGEISTTCAAGTPSSSATAPCNVYTEADLARPATDFAGSTCSASAPDRHWCPTSRLARQSGTGGPPDYLGVWVRVRHDFVTNFFGGSLTITDNAVMRLEPQL